MLRLIGECHRAVLVATEDYPWWMRPFSIVGWWLTLVPKFPIMLAYAWDDDEEHEQQWP